MIISDEGIIRSFPLIRTSFCISGEEFDPDYITKQIHSSPTIAWRKGDIRRDWGGNSYYEKHPNISCGWCQVILGISKISATLDILTKNSRFCVNLLLLPCHMLSLALSSLLLFLLCCLLFRTRSSRTFRRKFCLFGSVRTLGTALPLLV